MRSFFRGVVFEQKMLKNAFQETKHDEGIIGLIYYFRNLKLWRIRYILIGEVCIRVS